ncbi:DUF2332 domain-containing protein [Nonomuraea sp. NPDC050451]|uniref:DUF2332 domain-containing protein n=1 Tax=Nonomuraea sp. NPDC050451 TaxID=3364364 RepID=UPI003793B7CF
MEPTTAEQYRRFASREARGSSPLYEQLASGVAGDPDLIALLSSLPLAKRQPNLLFAAARYVAGTPADYQDFRRSVLDHRDAVVATMLSRRTQTNEAARCAALYPLLAALPQPLALLEVGASAGLCLLPDRYGYDYDGRLAGDVDSPLRLSCRTEGEPRFAVPGFFGPGFFGPGAVTVAWRAGIDLNPLDVTDPDDVRWLRTLVWPEQHDRLRRLDTAIDVARADPPRVVRGDLNARLGEVAAQAPAHATLVVFHTAVLYYVPDAERATFVEQVQRLDGHWIAQEDPGVLPGVDARLHERPPADVVTYALALDGHPVAFSAMHGGRFRWLSA